MIALKKQRDTGNISGGRQSFLHGALILTAGMAMVKVIGALFKIPLKYSIGEYGMGLFNVAYNFYGPVFSLATAGFPVAVSRLVSESGSLGRWNDVRQVKRAAFPLFLGFGGAGMVLMTAFAPMYCEKIIGSPYALAPVLALAPAILFACVGSVYRGYYEGLRSMTQTAVSEVIEAIVKLTVGLVLSRWVIARCTAEYAASGTVFSLRAESADEAKFLTLSFAAAGAVLGVTLGSAAALAYLALRHHLKGDKIDPKLYCRCPKQRTMRETMRRLLAITVPIAVGSVATNVAGLIDATFLQSRLSSLLQREPSTLLGCFEGMIPEMYLKNPASIPTYLYGCYTLAMTVYLLVPALTQAFGISALPAVTEAWARGNRRELQTRMASVARVTAMFCFPAGLGIGVLAKPIVRALYGDESSSPIISGVLSLLAVASLAAAMCTPLSSMLQAVGRADLPVKLLAAAMCIKLSVNWVLCGIPEINIYGAAIGTLVCYLFLAVAQFWFLRRVTGTELSAWRLFFRPLLSSVLCAAGAGACFSAVSGALPKGNRYELAALALSIAMGAVIYIISLLLLGAVEKSDLNALPKGQKIAKMLEKRGWM